MIKNLAQTSGIQYSREQTQAIREAATTGLLLVTGGPGTGKTTILNGILELMGQMQSMPALPKSYFMTEPPPFRMPDDLPPPVVVNPFAGCSSEVSLTLMFYDAEGEMAAFWDNSMVIPVSRVPEWSKTDKGRPMLMMPDEAYQRLINLPSSLKAEKRDKEFRKKSQHNH
jgi:hypothetical protein